jgi:hypothetical protein
MKISPRGLRDQVKNLQQQNEGKKEHSHSLADEIGIPRIPEVY